MSRWRVWKDRGDWIVSSPAHEERCFRTWREAQDYADRQTRTREVTFHRQAFPMTVGKKQLVLTDPNTVAVIGKGGVMVTGFHRKHWGKIATALLTLAEQEVTT